MTLYHRGRVLQTALLEATVSAANPDLKGAMMMFGGGHGRGGPGGFGRGPGHGRPIDNDEDDVNTGSSASTQAMRSVLAGALGLPRSRTPS